MKGSSAIACELPLTASSDCLKASGSANCMRMTAWRAASLSSMRKYRRLDASPASGRSLLNVARKGKRVCIVSATSGRSGAASGRLVVAGSIVAISAALYWQRKTLSRNGVLRSALHHALSCEAAEDAPGGVRKPIQPRRRAERHERLMHFIAHSIKGRRGGGVDDGVSCRMRSGGPTECPIRERCQHRVLDGMQQFVTECFEEKFW